MRTLHEIRKGYALLDPLSMTRKFDKYMGEVAEKFDQLTQALKDVLVALDKIEKNTGKKEQS